MTAFDSTLCPIGESIAADRGWPAAVAQEFISHAASCSVCAANRQKVLAALGVSE
jgi:hypothetical protein